MIAFPDGTDHLEIVTVPDAATTFDVILEAASIDLVTGAGPTLCSINKIGCPATNCFCDAAHYWAYYDLHAATSKWVASAMVWAASFPPTAPSWASPGAASMKATTRPFSRRFTPSPNNSRRHDTPPPVSVPEPGTYSAAGSGLAGRGGVRTAAQVTETLHYRAARYVPR